MPVSAQINSSKTFPTPNSMAESKPERTESEYRHIVQACKEVFLQKHQDYGSAWRVLRPSSLTDQIYIKAQRIRSIQEKGSQSSSESLEEDLVAIVNYCIMALIQLHLPSQTPLDLPAEQVSQLYDQWVEQNIRLLHRKNHDYGEAWRQMRISSMIDLILMKLRRIKQIEDNQGNTRISEGVAANYQDIMNYAVFCLIRLKDEEV